MMEDDIAIIGIGVRFPGDATSAEALWRIISLGESKWSEFPTDRLNINGYYHPSGDRQGSISFRGAHFLAGDISAFDAPFFSITADEAKAIDPQQRMLLEVCYEAIENAGLQKENINGSDSAVYIGSFVKDYEQICLRDPEWQPKYAATGNGMAIMANRISYVFNFHGPSMTIDTGCSGSLVSVHQAAQSLRTHETSMAIAGGVGLMLTPSTIMPMTALNFLSPDGKCFTFDSRANGYGRGEGVGIVVMKRLSDALHDGDPIRAIIRGSHVNQDGTTTGITLPSKEAQVANIQAAYRNAGLSFDQTAYVECHGTGTQAGDWRELNAISETLSAGRYSYEPIIVGSIKPNIGHLEGAAGVAALIKAILMLEHGKIPPNINFETGHPNINFDAWHVKVPQQLLDWPKPGVRRVSVNCFGFGGTNAHVILDEAPRASGTRDCAYLSPSVSYQPRDGKSRLHSNASLRRQEQTPILFCYSSHEKSGVNRILISHLEYIEAKQGESEVNLRDYAYTLACRRSKLEWRTFFIAETAPELVSNLKAFDWGLVQRSTPDLSTSVCFLFGGQGTQWAEMGRDLMRFEKYRISIWEASYYLKTRLGSSYDLLEEILRNKAHSRLSNPSISQPATTAVQIAIVELLACFGIRPKRVVGHSSGEIAAAFAAGALSREDAWEVAYYRGLATATLPVLAPKLRGAMIVVSMSRTEAERYLEVTRQSAQVACINSLHSTTISGRSASINNIANDLKQKGIFHRVLDVKIAYHSSHMKLIAPDYRALLRHIIPRSLSPGIRMFSSVTGKEITGKELNFSYWVRNLVSPVQYLSAIDAMMSVSSGEQPNVLVEISPRSALRSSTLDITSKFASKPSLAYHSIMDEKYRETRTLLQVVGDLWCRGYRLNMNIITAQGSKRNSAICLTDLPPYPWNHDKTYWHESHLDKSIRFREYPRQDLVGAPTPDSTPFERRWRGFIRISENPWLQDHQIQRTIIYPAAGMVCMVLEAAKQITTPTQDILGYEIRDMKIERAMIIPNTIHGLEVTLHIRIATSNAENKDFPASQEFTIYSKPLDKPWERHATGILRLRHQTADFNADFQSHISRYKELVGSCVEALTPRHLYEQLDVLGINYGHIFQNIVKLHKYGNSCVSEVRIPDTQSAMPGKFEYPHLLHPATLDSMFQTLFAVKPTSMVPTFIGHLFVSAKIRSKRPSGFYGYATAREYGIQGATGTLFMQQNGSETSHIHADGLHFTSIPLSTGSFLPNYHNLCSEIVWKEDTLSPMPTSLSKLVETYAHKYPNLAVLQFGVDPSIESTILGIVASNPATTPALSRYTIVKAPTENVNPHREKVVRHATLKAFMETRTIDALPALPAYHIIIASSTAAPSGLNLEQFLRPGGIILREIWFTNQDCSFKSDIVFSSRDIHDTDETGNFLQFEDAASNFIRHFQVYRSPHEPRQIDSIDLVLLKSNAFHLETASFVAALRNALEAKKRKVILSEIQPSNVLRDKSLLAGRVVISLLDIAQEGAGSVYNWNRAGFEMFKTIHNTARGIIWITKGASLKPDFPKASPIIGLVRTLLSEDPLRTVVTIDLSIDTNLGKDHVIDNVLSILDCRFGPGASTVGSEPRDVEYALDKNRVFVPRLRPISPLNRLIEGNDKSRLTIRSLNDYRLSKDLNLGLELEIAKPGLLENGLYFVERMRPKLEDNQVEVLFDEAPLTGTDLETVMGRSIERTLGMDVCGCVGRVGDNVTAFKSGDRVCSLLSSGAFQDAFHVHVRWVKKHQTGFIPSLYISAYFGLIYVGRITSAKEVLVHLGASAAGLAAVDIGLIVGAKVFATVSGPDLERQRSILLSKGLPKDHILDASSEHFVRVVQSKTKGKGVDAVYNLTGAYHEADFRCIRSSGCVIHLASKSTSTVSFKAPLNSAVFVSLDLRRLLREDPDLMSDIFERTVKLVFSHRLDFMASPAVRTDFSLQNLEAALRHLEESSNVGYAMVGAVSPQSDSVLVLNDTSTKSLAGALDANGTYVLAGGLGGLGRSISEHLVSNGVRHLAFLSRSGASSERSQSWTADLRTQGVNFRVYNVDICGAEALGRVVDEISAQMPPIRGLFQCAAVIKDAVFENMVWSDWTTAFRPKALGTWNLVQSISAVARNPFFILLASSSGVIGNRGQANYAAGNCFLDAMARNLRLQGKHAVSIDLGPILGSGMLAEDDATLDMLRANGFYGIRHEDFLRVLTHAISREICPGIPTPPQVVLGVGTGGIFNQNKPADPYWLNTAMYSYLNLVDMPPPDLSLAGSSPSRSQNNRTQLARCADISTAAKIVKVGLVALLAKSMTLLPQEIDTRKPPTSYGVDSLVAVGIRNWVLRNCGVQISVFEVLSDESVDALAQMIVGRGGYGQSNHGKAH